MTATLPSLSLNHSLVSKLPSRPLEAARLPDFITVRFGDNRKIVVNTFCRNMHLIHFLRRTCGCKRSEVVDLVSWSSGKLQNIHTQRQQYAYRLLSNREDYLVVKVVYPKGEELQLLGGGKVESQPTYLPLLNGLDQVNPDLAESVRRLSQPAKGIKLKAKWSSLGRKGMDQSPKSPKDLSPRDENSNSLLNSVKMAKQKQSEHMNGSKSNGSSPSNGGRKSGKISLPPIERK